MLDLPELDHVILKDRPLVVCDVDDVVLEFLKPFENYLAHGGSRLIPRSYRLHGNIVSLETEAALEDSVVSGLIDSFFDQQERWQTPFAQAVETLHELGQDNDVVFLTAMPPRYAQQRRRLLDQLNLDFPLIATETPKGPVVKAIHRERTLPLAFIDDMAHNLRSVGEHMAECLLIQIMPDSEIHRLAPKAAENVHRATDWPHAGTLLNQHFSAAGRNG